MLNNDRSDHNEHYSTEKVRWTCFAAFALILSIAGLAIVLAVSPPLASKTMVTLFVTQAIAAGIVRLTFFARTKHQNLIAIVLVTITSLAVAAFIAVIACFHILPIYKDFANF